ncbi:hypothetical protein CH298_15590 [Rhodococcoides fascians]|nr:hypothetical protein CH303_15470 [Rhodococcus fascians]OZF16649.1 hypothetical protein CH298_15590 [Rhodococcus fascians]OZF19665.1 hypothetical protein CH297_15485 [Rhodococcus fascians]OZF65931.1 hypothetical protein CH308_15390 [Rhodococcus fascians]OZF69083.1 hypothetical protein CH307_15585 [Rhodococcus fascians]
MAVSDETGGTTGRPDASGIVGISSVGGVTSTGGVDIAATTGVGLGASAGGMAMGVDRNGSRSPETRDSPTTREDPAGSADPTSPETSPTPADPGTGVSVTTGSGVFGVSSSSIGRTGCQLFPCRSAMTDFPPVCVPRRVPARMSPPSSRIGRYQLHVGSGACGTRRGQFSPA